MNTTTSKAKLVTLAVLLLGPAVSFAASGRELIARKGEPMKIREGWPIGVSALMNGPLRTDAGWSWFTGSPNDVVDCSLKVTTPDDVGQVIKLLAKIQAPVLRIQLDPGRDASTPLVPRAGVGAVFSIGHQPTIDRWFRGLPEVEPGVRAQGADRLTKPFVALPPTLTIYASHPEVELTKLRIPLHVISRPGDADHCPHDKPSEVAVKLPVPADLKRLTNEELMQEYEAAGLALDGTLDVITDVPISRLANLTGEFGPAVKRFVAARKEIIRRGAAVIPELIRFLEAESVRQRPPREKYAPPTGFSVDLLGLLTYSRDPRAAEAAWKLLDGRSGRANAHARRAALDSLECLTYTAFHRVRPHSRTDSVAVQHELAIPEDSFADFDLAARLYRKWLDGEGKDPNQWLPLARRRARTLMAGKDPDAIFCTALFLSQDSRDDSPDKTLARLAEVLDDFRPSPDPFMYLFYDQAATTIGNWLEMFALYGALARPHTRSVLRLEQELGDNSWGTYARLRRIGGSEVLAYLFEKLPAVSAKVARLDADPDAPKSRTFTSSDERGWWYSSLRELRSAIDDNAGRIFATDDERTRWWAVNRDKPYEQALRANLPILVDQVDDGSRSAVWIAKRLLPDLPLPRSAAEPTQASQWRREHAHRLEYDDKAGSFRLK